MILVCYIFVLTGYFSIYHYFINAFILRLNFQDFIINHSQFLVDTFNFNL